MIAAIGGWLWLLHAQTNVMSNGRLKALNEQKEG